MVACSNEANTNISVTHTRFRTCTYKYMPMLLSAEVNKSKSCLHEALQRGFVTVIMLLCIVQGLPGVGKTHLKFLLLDQEPPHLRTSTNCAEAPVRIEIGTVTGTRVKTIGGRWQDIDDEDMFDVVAEMILLAEPESISEVDHLEEVYFEAPKASRKHKVPKKPKPSEMIKPSENPKSPEKDTPSEKSKPSNSVFSRILSWMKGNRTSTDEKLESPQEEASETAGASAAQPVSSNVSNACQKAMNVIMDKLVHCITKMRGRMNTTDTSERKFSLKSKWVYFNDSGGQPEYHELLPLFVRRISSALCVIRLPDKLDETQKVEYYKDGKLIGDVQRSQFTAKDTVQCLVNTIQSYSTQDEPPKIIVVGTHLDQLKEQSKETKDKVDTDTQEEATTDQASMETLEEKNRQLIEMLERDFSDQLVYYSESSTSKELIFPLNTLKPGEHEKAVAESLRHSIESSGAKEVQVPIWWHIMELLLEELSKILGRGVLSRAECLEMARLLKIEEEEFDAALVYFDELNVIKYSPDSLRNTVFIKSQIPLDKVSELVYHSYLLRKPTTALSEEWRHFRDRGVVSKEVLKTFPRHYVEDVFSVDDLVEYLKQLLVLAPIPKPVEASSLQLPSTTSDQPSSTTSDQPSSTASAQLSSTASAQPSSTASTQPSSTASAQPSSTANTQLSSTASAPPFSTASAQPSSTTNTQLSSTASAQPLSSTASIKPLSSAASARSSSTASDQPSSSTPQETHYIMPTLWKTVPEGDLESRRIYSPVAATLLVRFPRRFRRAGVFCCFVVHLIRYCGWDLLLETKEPLYRNCIKLRLLTSPPLTVVLIDSNTHIEVHVNASSGIPVSEYTGLLPIIKQAILSGIFSACRALKYTQTKPHLTFYCPHTHPSASTDDPKVQQHTATLTLDRRYWRCDLDPDSCFGPLENQHKIWFGIPQGIYTLLFSL